ncbi:hypothetical protein BCY91_12670 [Pelobium manganitolerans]|uniref:Methylamine utilisation protein MauE domain-containing protein n=2 Tax=Pelobium manganitolerans TaxID=1842495 RepID=A0A419S1X7_9SPHI|nr:hypothetical protein BCY91_12670 [Pelobium manganitolerans]
MDLNGSLQSLYLQPIPHWMAEILLIQLPLAEYITAMLLIIPVSRRWGYRLSLGLLTVFSLYIIFIKVKAFERVPCSCGGLIASLNWTQHLIVNLLLLALNVAGLVFHLKREE